MRDVIFIYLTGDRVCQSTYRDCAAQEVESILGDRIIGKIILAAK